MILVVSNTQPGQTVANAIAEQHPVELVPTTRYAVPLILRGQADAVIVDVTHTNVESIDALFGLPDIPAVGVLDEFDNLNKVIRAMQIGAKDYYVLSLHPVVDIVQRAVKLTQLTPPRQSAPIAPLRLMPDRNLAIFFNVPILLSDFEFRALSALYRHYPNITPHTEIMKAIGGDNLSPLAQTTRMRAVMMRLRNKLNLLHVPNLAVVSVRKAGYILRLPPARS